MQEFEERVCFFVVPDMNQRDVEQIVVFLTLVEIADLANFLRAIMRNGAFLAFATLSYVASS